MQLRKAKLLGRSHTVALAILAAVMAAGYWALDAFSETQRDMLTVESRGMLLIQALSKFRTEQGRYPDSLDALVPRFLNLLPRCPNGDFFLYRLAGTDYFLSCSNVVFRQKPYLYNSNSHKWLD